MSSEKPDGQIEDVDWSRSMRAVADRRGWSLDDAFERPVVVRKGLEPERRL